MCCKVLFFTHTHTTTPTLHRASRQSVLIFFYLTEHHDNIISQTYVTQLTATAHRQMHHDTMQDKPCQQIVFSKLAQLLLCNYHANANICNFNANMRLPQIIGTHLSYHRVN